MAEVDVRDCPDCDDGTKGKYDGRILIGGRGIYTCPVCNRKWQDADERPSYKGAAVIPRSPQENYDHMILGDEAHPSTRDYVATNLLAALDLVPDTGDWHGQVRLWCEANRSGKLQANPGLIPSSESRALAAEAMVRELTEQLRDLKEAGEPFHRLDLDLGDEWREVCEPLRNELYAAGLLLTSCARQALGER